jgi:hypothetical protein
MDAGVQDRSSAGPFDPPLPQVSASKAFDLTSPNLRSDAPDGADCSLVQQALDALIRGDERRILSDRENKPTLPCQLDEFTALLRRDRKRLLDQNMLARSQCLARHEVVKVVGQRDIDGVDPIVREKLVVVGGRSSADTFRDERAASRIDVRDGGDFRVFVRGLVAVEVISTDQSQPDHADAEHGHRAVLRARNLSPRSLEPRNAVTSPTDGAHAGLVFATIVQALSRTIGRIGEPDPLRIFSGSAMNIPRTGASAR